MQDYYAARAPEYDRIYLKPERQADLRRIEAWLPGVFARRTVLEVACGTGYWTRFIAPAAAGVVAVDAAEPTLQIARSRVAQPTVQFIEGDAYALPARETSFDAAFAGFWWSHIPLARIDGFLGGLHRALKPGASVVFLDNRFVPGSSTPVADTDAEGNTFQVRTLADGGTHHILKNFPSADALHAAVAPYAATSRYHAWDYFWALEYTLA